jgi:Threonine synthase
MCFGPLEVKYNWEYIRKNISIEKISKGPKSIWRYIDLLPLESDYEIDLQSGFTPLVRAKNLGENLGLEYLLEKK